MFTIHLIDNIAIFLHVEPYVNDTYDILTPIGRVASPRWIPSIDVGSVFYWRLTTDLQTAGRGYIFNFPVVKSKDEDPRLCENSVTFRINQNNGPLVSKYCLNQLPDAPIFVGLGTYYSAVVIFNTDDSKQYGFISKYAAGRYLGTKVYFFFSQANCLRHKDVFVALLYRKN